MNEEHICVCCGNTEDSNHMLHEVSTLHPDGEKQQLLVCDNCLPFFQSTETEILVRVLGGPTYTVKQRPPFWHNDVALEYQHFHVPYSQLPLVSFPLPRDVTETNALDTQHRQ